MLVAEGLALGLDRQGLEGRELEGQGLGQGLESNSGDGGSGTGTGSSGIGSSVNTVGVVDDTATTAGGAVTAGDGVSPNPRAGASAGMLLLFRALCESERDAATTPITTPATTGYHTDHGVSAGGGGDDGPSPGQDAVSAMAAAAMIVSTPKGQFYNRPQVYKHPQETESLYLTRVQKVLRLTGPVAPAPATHFRPGHYSLARPSTYY